MIKPSISALKYLIPLAIARLSKEKKKAILAFLGIGAFKTASLLATYYLSKPGTTSKILEKTFGKPKGKETEFQTGPLQNFWEETLRETSPDCQTILFFETLSEDQHKIWTYDSKTGEKKVIKTCKTQEKETLLNFGRILCTIPLESVLPNISEQIRKEQIQIRIIKDTEETSSIVIIKN